MGLLGFGGVIRVVQLLWSLPPVVETEIVTVQNQRRRYRLRTVLLGWFTLVALLTTMALFSLATSKLHTLGKVCELDNVPRGTVTTIILPLLAGLVVLSSFAWLSSRVVKLNRK